MHVTVLDTNGYNVSLRLYHRKSKSWELAVRKRHYRWALGDEGVENVLLNLKRRVATCETTPDDPPSIELSHQENELR